MFEKFKPWVTSSYGYREIAPAFFTGGKIITGTGQGLFAIPKITYYITGDASHPANLPASIALILCSIASNILIRGPMIYANFNETNGRLDIHVEGVNEPITYDDLNSLGKIIYGIFKTLSWITILSNQCLNYLGSIIFIEYLSGFVINNIHDTVIGEAALQLFSVFLVLCNIVTSMSNSQRRTEENAIAFAYKFENHKFKFGKYEALAIGVLFLGTISIPFFTNFSTNVIYEKIPGLSLPTATRIVINGTAIVASTTSYVISYLPAFHRAVKPSTEADKAKQKTYWPPKTTLGVAKMKLALFAGSGETLSVGTGNFLGCVYTLEDFFDWNTKGAGVVAFAILTATTSAMLYYIFSIDGGYKRALQLQQRQRHLAVKAQTPQEVSDKLESQPDESSSGEESALTKFYGYTEKDPDTDSQGNELRFNI